MSVAFLQLVSQPKDRFDPHLCAKISVKRSGSSTLITKDRISCVKGIKLGGTQIKVCTTHRRSASAGEPAAYVQARSFCSQTLLCPPLNTG